MSSGWWCGGVGWGTGVPVLRWGRGGGGPLGVRESGLLGGGFVGFRVVGERVCGGARGNPCPVRAVLGGRGTGGLCGECARLDRMHSVAADALADDPRVYRVYLAWFGPGMVKVGITREERGAARLLEQGAVVFSWLGRGPLMAARRAEESVRVALGVPDRIPYAEKRRVRAGLPGVVERGDEVRRMHARVVALDGWPESLERLEFAAVDHGGVFGLDGLPPAGAVVRELVEGGCVAGRILAVAGPDLHLATGRGEGPGGVVVLDTRLMVGWELVGVRREGEREGDEEGEGVEGSGGGISVPLVDVRGGGVQGGLF
ncbi:DUF2797 domain-containing protein [Streptomyces liangshanensis]|uniref:DUF2797 domain-containing protein n=1 Tax=Streptomyces liangshanensis TaxID=2717324 RepID=A0A6G9H077_9ACTN|nr:DUF2797 domain-containing protein [Streptomyces liangshanensis]QIQ03905.1 DUF2797 domain-containing protein [Streptomyces liangshanensis]